MNKRTLKESNAAKPAQSTCDYINAMTSDGTPIKISKADLMAALAPSIPNTHKVAKKTTQDSLHLASIKASASSNVLSAGLLISLAQNGGAHSNLYFVSFKSSSTGSPEVKMKTIVNLASYTKSNSEFLYSFDSTTRTFDVYLKGNGTAWMIVGVLALNTNAGEASISIPMSNASATELAQATSITVE